MRRVAALAVCGIAAAAGARPAAAEPHFSLAKQYTRCVACHHSPTGGGLLTAYGRSLARQEVSTFGKSEPGEEPHGRWREEAFLFGLVGESDALSIGADLRPSHLEIRSDGFEEQRDLWMRADLQAALNLGRLQLYGEIGREPVPEPNLNSYEYWVSWQKDNGLGLRAGRFLPAFGVRLADHTALSRRHLGFDRNDQAFALELSDVGERHLVQFSFGPGRAESILEDDGRRGFLATGRAQFDLRSRQVLVLSGMYRGVSDRAPGSWFGSIAHGWAPSPRLALWTELVERASDGWNGTPEYTVVHETSFELLRGVWLRFSPQIQTELNNVSGGVWRTALGVQVFPRAHWNLNLSWMHDAVRQADRSFDTLLVQLHLYL